MAFTLYWQIQGKTKIRKTIIIFRSIARIYMGPLLLTQIDLNTLRLRQNGRHFADDIFKCIFLNENDWILIKIALKFVPHGLINNIQALIQIMAWRRLGDKPLSGPMMVRLPAHICVTRPQWVNPSMNKYYIHNEKWDEISYPFSNNSATTVEVLEWISNSTPQIIMNVIIYQWWDLSKIKCKW